jgi:hypothetical protein
LRTGIGCGSILAKIGRFPRALGGRGGEGGGKGGGSVGRGVRRARGVRRVARACAAHRSTRPTEKSAQRAERADSPDSMYVSLNIRCAKRAVKAGGRSAPRRSAPFTICTHIGALRAHMIIRRAKRAETLDSIYDSPPNRRAKRAQQKERGASRRSTRATARNPTGARCAPRCSPRSTVHLRLGVAKSAVKTGSRSVPTRLT